jgi:hypothetical protein
MIWFAIGIAMFGVLFCAYLFIRLRRRWKDEINILNDYEGFY